MVQSVAQVIGVKFSVWNGFTWSISDWLKFSRHRPNVGLIFHSQYPIYHLSSLRKVKTITDELTQPTLRVLNHVLFSDSEPYSPSLSEVPPPIRSSPTDAPFCHTCLHLCAVLLCLRLSLHRELTRSTREKRRRKNARRMREEPSCLQPPMAMRRHPSLVVWWVLEWWLWLKGAAGLARGSWYARLKSGSGFRPKIEMVQK